MKIFFKLLIIFMLVSLLYGNLMAKEEYKGTYTGSFGAQGEMEITIDDGGCVSGKINGVYSDRFENKANAVLIGTYDANKCEIKGKIEGDVIDSEGNRIGITGIFNGKFSGNNEIWGEWECGGNFIISPDSTDTFYLDSNGTYKVKLQSNPYLGLILIEGISYINNKAADLAELYLFSNKDEVSLKTEAKSAIISIIPGSIIFFGENTSAQISQKIKNAEYEQYLSELAIKNFGGKARVVSSPPIYGDPSNAADLRVIQEISMQIIAERLKKEREKEKIFGGLRDAISTINADVREQKSKCPDVSINSKFIKLADFIYYKPSYYALAYNGLSYDLLASNNNSQLYEYYIFAENGTTKIYAIEGTLAISDENEENSVIIKPGEMTSYTENSKPSSPQPFETGLPEKIFAENGQVTYNQPAHITETQSEMVYIQGGTFEMGSNSGDGAEAPVHTVEVSSFYMGKYEVTNKEYKRYDSGHSGCWSEDNYPVESVSWYDAVGYCNWLSDSEGLSRCYSGSGDSINLDMNKNGYRLPTEAEWEYACRAGTTTEYYWGSSMDDSYCWYDENSGGTVHPVGQKNPNSFGLYDMSGNVLEWCWDWWGKSYYSSSPYSNPASSSGLFSLRVERGGSWKSDAKYCRSASRGYFGGPDRWSNVVGFRLVRRP